MFSLQCCGFFSFAMLCSIHSSSCHLGVLHGVGSHRLSDACFHVIQLKPYQKTKPTTICSHPHNFPSDKDRVGSGYFSFICLPVNSGFRAFRQMILSRCAAWDMFVETQIHTSVVQYEHILRRVQQILYRL